MYDILSLANGLQTDQEQRSYIKMTQHMQRQDGFKPYLYTILK